MIVARNPDPSRGYFDERAPLVGGNRKHGAENRYLTMRCRCDEFALAGNYFGFDLPLQQVKPAWADVQSCRAGHMQGRAVRNIDNCTVAIEK